MMAAVERMKKIKVYSFGAMQRARSSVTRTTRAEKDTQKNLGYLNELV